MKKILLSTIKFFGHILPQTVPELIYTKLPRFLKTPVNIFLSSCIPEYIKVGTVEIALNKEDPVLCGARTLGVYEKWESRLIQEKLRPGMVVMDLGANVGLYTALAAAIVGQSGKVFAFEPGEDNFSFLKKTVLKNDFSNVECYQVAISDRTEEGRLYLSTENLADHRIYDSQDDRMSTPVKLMTLDHFVTTHSCSRVDFIKMDIQGAEGLAIKGMETVFNSNPHLQIFSEFWPLGLSRTGESPVEFLTTLQKFGFSIFEINRTTGVLSLVRRVEEFAGRFHGREFANLYCTR